MVDSKRHLLWLEILWTKFIAMDPRKASVFRTITLSLKFIRFSSLAGAGKSVLSYVFFPKFLLQNLTICCCPVLQLSRISAGCAQLDWLQLLSFIVISGMTRRRDCAHCFHLCWSSFAASPMHITKFFSLSMKHMIVANNKPATMNY